MIDGSRRIRLKNGQSIRKTHLQEASSWLEDALYLDEEDFQVIERRIKKQLRLGQFELAEKQARKALRIIKNGTSFNLLAEVLLAQGKLAQAEKSARNALKFDNGPTTMRLMIQVLLAKGADKDLIEAEDVAGLIIQSTDEFSSKDLCLFAQIKLAKEELPDAEKFAEWAVELNDESQSVAENYLMLARVLLAQGRIKESAKLAEQASQLSDHPKFLQFLEQVTKSTKVVGLINRAKSCSSAEALSLLKDAERMSGNDFAALRSISSVYRLQGLIDEAEEVLRRCVEHEPAVRSRQMLAEILRKGKKYEESLAICPVTTRSGCLCAAYCLTCLGEWKKAMDYFDKAATLPIDTSNNQTPNMRLSCGYIFLYAQALRNRVNDKSLLLLLRGRAMCAAIELVDFKGVLHAFQKSDFQSAIKIVKEENLSKKLKKNKE
jgi:tetratricopeptide (TPR) repeat protein